MSADGDLSRLTEDVVKAIAAQVEKLDRDNIFVFPDDVRPLFAAAELLFQDAVFWNHECLWGSDEEDPTPPVSDTALEHARSVIFGGVTIIRTR